MPSPTNFTAIQTGLDATSGGGTATALDQGGAVTGGTFFNSTGASDVYQQNYFYCDYNSGRVMRAGLSSSNAVKSIDYFTSGGNGLVEIATGPDGALYYSGYYAAIYRVAFTNFTSQQFIVTPAIVRMIEGGGAVVNIRLAMAPATNVTVNVARTAGDSGINVTSGGTLTFSPTNWSVPQPVRMDAVEDSNSANSTATLTVSASGIANQTITVYALDVSAPPALGPVTVSAGVARIGLSGESGKTYVLEGNTNLNSAWAPISTNMLIGNFTNILDPLSSTLQMRFYRARLLQ